MTRSPADTRLRFRTWLKGLVLLAACTAPPRPDPPPPQRLAPLPAIHVRLDAPDLSAEALQTLAVAVVEQALAPIPEVDALVSRTDDGHATIAAVVTNPEALAPIRDALGTIQRDLPPSVAPPLLFRAGRDTPALALRVRDDPYMPALVERVEQTPGVARAELCGGHEPVLRIDLDRHRLAGMPIDRVAEAVRLQPLSAVDGRMVELRQGPSDLAAWAATAIPGTSLALRDLATISLGGRPRRCADLLDATHVTILVHAQHGADLRRVAADVRAAAAGTLPGSPTFIPPTDDDLVVLEVEMPSPAGGPAIDRCLQRMPLVRAWSLVRRDPADAHARVVLVPTPAGPGEPTGTNDHLRDALSFCTGTAHIAVLAPDADADHPASVELLGPDPAALAELADLVAARLRDLPGVTLLRVHAARPRPVREVTIDRAACAARGVRAHALGTAAALAHGPLELGHAGGVPVLIDMLERPGTIDQVLADLSVSSPGGPVAVAALVTLTEAPPTPTPRWRIDRHDAAAVELRLRRAADREAVQAVVEDLPLPPGVQLRLSRGFPPLTP